MIQCNEILDWLRESDPDRLDDLWQLADRTRQEYVGGEVHLRGLIELSNYCVRLCGYCGLRAGNAGLKRYRMSDDEILGCVRMAVGFGYGTVVLQSGEDPELTGRRIADLVRRIKAETPLAVTLSLGERGDEELAAWREAGADRYLLRFETSNRGLYERIHPPLPHMPVSGDQADSPMCATLDSSAGDPCHTPPAGLRSGQRRDDRHSRPDLRRPGRRHRAVRPVGSRHDRRRALPATSRHAAGDRRAWPDAPAANKCRPAKR